MGMRRFVLVMVACLLGSGLAIAQTGGQAVAPAAKAEVLSKAEVYPYEAMPVRKMANGGESRDVLHGTLATGEVMAVHESQQPAGMKANPQHVIQHTEIICVIEGTLEFLHGDQADKVGPGGVIYVAMGTLHTVKNVGIGPARYVVVAVGGDVKK